MLAGRRFSARLSLLCALLIAACSSARPLPAFVKSTAEDPKYPRARFLVEVGSSPQSPADAELQAKAKLSADISAEITGETRSFLAESNGHAAQTVSEAVTQKTRFERADLITIVDRGDSAGMFYARAVLDRARTDAELQRAQSPELVSFNEFAQSALQASQAGKPGDFATATARASAMIASLDAQFIVRRAVLGRPSEDERNFIGVRNALLQAAADAESHRVVEVRVEGAPSAMLLQLTVAAVHKLGLRVGESQTCADVIDHPASASELVIFPEEKCGESSLGERCVVAVRLHARGCLGGGEGEARTAQMPGIHPSDRDRARAAAWKRITPETVESAVGQALRGAQVIAGTAATGC